MHQFATARPVDRPYEVVFERGPFRCRRYGNSQGCPIVILYPFINDPSILDFTPDRSVIGGLLETGRSVVVLEWLDASPLDRSIGLADVVSRYLDEAIETAAGGGPVHLLGYSTSAPLALASASLTPGRVLTLTLVGPPLAFGHHHYRHYRLLANGLTPDRIETGFDTVPALGLESAFLLEKALEWFLAKPAVLWDEFEDAVRVEDAGRIARWMLDGPAIPSAVIAEFVRDLVLGDELLDGEWSIDGEVVAPEAVSAPTALVVGTDDDFVPPHASLPVLESLETETTTVIEVPTGHIGLSTATIAHEEAWPAVHDWLDRHEGTSRS